MPRSRDTRAARLRALARLSRLVSSSLDLREVLTAIAGAAAELMQAPLVAFWIVDESARTLTVQAFSDPPAAGDFRFQTLTFEQGGVGWVATHRTPLNVPDVFTDGRFVALDWWRRHRLCSFYAVPIILDGALLAVLALNGSEPFHVDDADRDLLEGFVAQAAVALANARLFAETTRRRREAEALAEVGRVVSQSLDLREVGTRIVVSVCGLFDAKTSALYRLSPASGDLELFASAGLVVPRSPVLPRGTGTVGLAVLERRPVATPDVLNDPRISLPPSVREQIEKSAYEAILAIPLAVQERVIGALAVGDLIGRVFTDEEIRLAQAFADQAALALENARLYAEAELRRRQAEVLAEVARAINASLDLGTVLQRIAESARELCASDLALIGLRDVGAEAASLRFWSGARYRQYGSVTIEPGKGAGGRVLLTGRPFRTDDWEEDARISKDYLALVRAEGIVAELVAPIQIGARVAGLLYVQNREARPFTDRDETVLLQLADHAAVAIQNAQLFAGERAARAEAEAAETRYRLLFERNMAGVFRTTRDGRVLECNEAVARILGYGSREEVLALNTKVLWRSLIDRDRLLAAIDRRQPFSSEEVRLRRKDRSEVWVLLNILAVEEGETQYLEGMILDITDRKRVEEAERALERLESVASLASAASHEINNPLTVVVGALDLVDKRASQDPLVREWVDRGREAVRRIKQIIERMARITRLQLSQEWPGLPPMLDIRRSSADPPAESPEDQRRGGRG